MIIDFSCNIKSYKTKIIDNDTIFVYICPKCGAKNRFIRHAYYDRSVCFLDGNLNVCEEKLTILRLLCKSCSSTHAVLPGDIIPYGVYDKTYILNVLSAYFVYNQSILMLSQKYSISYQTLYNFIRKFRSFLNSIYIVLKTLINFYEDISNEAAIINAINDYPGNFSYHFYISTKWIVLMTKFKDILPKRIYVGGHLEPPTQLVNS